MMDIQHIEAQPAAYIEAGDGTRINTRWTVTVTVEVAAKRATEAVEAVEGRLTR